MAGDRHDKTEAPTAKRKKEGRKEGRVVRSEDLVTWLSVLVATWVVPGLISRTTEATTATLRDLVEVAHRPDSRVLPTMVGRSLIGGIGSVVPAILVLGIIAVLGNLAQVGFLLTGKPLQPKLSRLNPIQGLKRIFSVKSLWATATTVAKLALILAVAWTLVRGSAAQLLSAPFRSVGASLADAGHLAVALVRSIAAAALVLGLADYAFQRRQHYREMKMSKHEIKQESRESDGNPEMKSRQRQVRAQMSRNRMLASVSKADVIITNPTHLAIAVQYVREAGAPKVLARGSDELAARIREEASRSGVPCVEAKPLARALYSVCRVGEEIPPELYQGVATVLAFLHRLGLAQRRDGVRVGLSVPDTWTPSQGRLERVPPARRRLLERQAAAASAAVAAGVVQASPS